MTFIKTSLPLTTQGDIITRNASNNIRLGIGANNEYLKSNGVDILWGGISGGSTVIGNGNYIGDNTVNRALTHGLGTTPKYIAIISRGLPIQFKIIEPGFITYFSWSGFGSQSVTNADNTNFYVGNAGSYIYSANSQDIVYYWVAFG